jgi:peroxiredoxin
MKEKTETLAVGDRAPEFALPAANKGGTFSLSEWLQRGPVILEFLRGTW